jgi:hypothetical protein
MNSNQPILSNRRQHIILLGLCILTFLLFGVYGNYLHTFKRNHISSDVVEYYSFIPAAFECADLSFSKGCPQFYWAQTTKDGRHVNKRSIGMAYMYTPIYAISRISAGITGHKQDAYSPHTQKILVIGIWVYVCIGLFFLGKALFRFFSPWVVVLTLIMLVTATNLIWYTNGEPLFTHGVNFMWFSILIYATIQYHRHFKLTSLLAVALSISMLALIRPNNLLLGIFPFLYGVVDKTTFLNKIQLFKNNYGQVMLAVVVFFIPVVPQLMYWKYATGHWVYYSYQGENFYWSRPFIMEVLFSFRKGWLIYTPVMLLSVVGMLFLKQRAREFFAPVLFIFPVFLYVISCWWAWSYGGCYGMRPMIDIYALLAFPVAAILGSKKWWAVLPAVIWIGCCSWLNINQAWQYSVGILHYDQMNKKTYFSIWRKTVYPENYDLTLAYPDYQKELTGKGSYYSNNELSYTEFSMKFLRAKFICATDSGEVGVKANHAQAAHCDAFVLVYNAAEKKYAIRSSETKNYLRMDAHTNFFHFDEPDVLHADFFGVKNLGENKFALKAPNGFYITCTEYNQFRLKADALEINPAAYIVFRKFIR